MSHYKLGPLGAVMLDPNLTFLEPRTEQHGLRPHVGDLAESLRIGDGLNLMQKLQISEIVDEDLLVQNDDDPVPAELDGFDLGAEGELADAAGLMVVPDHDLGGGVEGVGSASDDGEYVAAEEHLDQSHPAAWTVVAAEYLAEGVAVVDAEAEVGARREAAVVLIEGQVEEGGELGRGRV